MKARQIVINISETGILTTHGTPMTVAELNLYLDLAKKNLFDQGQADGMIETPTPEQAHLLLESGNGKRG